MGVRKACKWEGVRRIGYQMPGTGDMGLWQVETLSIKTRRVELYKGPGQDIGSFGAKGGCDQSTP